MKASIKAEWRKNRARPAFLIAAGLVAGVVTLFYSVDFYQATHPTAGTFVTSLLTLYPDQFVNRVMGAGFPLGAAMALVLGALLSGSEYSWGTLKTVLTQGPGRITALAGRIVAFQIWLGIMTLIMFGVAGAYSVGVAAVEGQSIVWPAALEVAKGFGAMWLVLSVSGSLGMALGVLFKQSAAALGVGLIYLTVLQVIVARFLLGFDGGAYNWIANLLDGQNASALLQSFTSSAFGRSMAPAIGAEQAVVVLSVYLACFLLVSVALLRERDVT